MNDFEAPPGFSSAPLSLPGELRDDSGKIKWVSEGTIDAYFFTTDVGACTSLYHLYFQEKTCS